MGRWFAAAAVGLFLAAATPPLPAQDAAPAGDNPAATRPAGRPIERTTGGKAVVKGAPSIELDCLSLLEQPDVFEAPINSDAFWTISAGPNRKLIQIPLVVKPSKDPYDLDGSFLRIKGGRILGYRFSDRMEIQASNQKARQEAATAVPLDDPPRVTRLVTILPNGTMKWKLEKTMLTGVVKPSERLYIFKLNPPALQAKRPPALGALVKAPLESAANFYDRKKEAAETSRQKTEEFNELQKKVKAAPEEFAEPISPLVWVMIDVVVNQEELEISEGPPPFPWKIRFDSLKDLRQGMKTLTLDTGPDNKLRLPGYLDKILPMMVDLAGDKNPLTPRLVANVMSRAEMVPRVNVDKRLYACAEAVLKSVDSEARNIITKELFHTLPSLQTAALLKIAAQDMAPTMVVEGLKSDLKRIAEDPAAMGNVVASTNKTLAEASGPSPAEVLAPVLETTKAHPELVGVLVNGVHFENIPDSATNPNSRLNQAIAYVIEQAPESALAGGWLDRQLLGAVDQRLVRRSLETLNLAGTSANAFGGVVDSALDVVLGPAKTKADQGVRPVPNLKGPVPISSSNHAIFNLLRAGDPALRTMAWRSLSRFAFAPPPAAPAAAPAAPPAGGAAGAAAAVAAAAGSAVEAVSSLVEQNDVYQTLVEAALAQQNTPPQVVDFLVRQREYARVADSLVVLVVKASDQVSIQATRALLRSRGAWPIDKAILNLSYGDRHAFAGRVYENVNSQSAPAVTALLRLRVDNSPLPAWLGKSIGAGALPSPTLWVKEFGGDEKILELVTSSDGDVAMGAVSALIWSAGGDDRILVNYVKRFRDLPDQSPANLLSQWASVRKEIFAERLRRAAGAYRLIIRPGPSAGIKEPVPAGDLSLGIVELKADSSGIRLGPQSLTLSVPDAKLAIRVEKPGELRNFNNDQINKLSIDKVVNAIDLLPQANGSWEGAFKLPNGQSADMILQPNAGT
ncbi:MAG: hypothetical protein NTW19_24825 [Planctomycetota bacterium]|nr:hypothetical protein [Planctomycetota bacterium]